MVFIDGSLAYKDGNLPVGSPEWLEVLGKDAWCISCLSYEPSLGWILVLYELFW